MHTNRCSNIHIYYFFSLSRGEKKNTFEREKRGPKQVQRCELERFVESSNLVKRIRGKQREEFSPTECGYLSQDCVSSFFKRTERERRCVYIYIYRRVICAQSSAGRGNIENTHLSIALRVTAIFEFRPSTMLCGSSERKEFPSSVNSLCACVVCVCSYT